SIKRKMKSRESFRVTTLFGHYKIGKLYFGADAYFRPETSVVNCSFAGLGLTGNNCLPHAPKEPKADNGNWR
ncbi:MAG: hypothetical protein ACI974_001589, partial [Paraglaciecola sp.]